MTILQDVGSENALLAELGRLKAENELLKANEARRAASRLHLKVSEKGAVSIYGLGKFPVTLYLSQFKALDAAWPLVQQFVKDNQSQLKTKD